VTMVTPRSGYDLEYYLDRAGEKTAEGRRFDPAPDHQQNWQPMDL